MAPTSLPDPDTSPDAPVSRHVADRASRRWFADEPVELADVAQLLWAAQGVTHSRDSWQMRAAPSAGATYPLVALLEVRAEGVEGLDPGVYRYEPGSHELAPERTGDVRSELVSAASDQRVVADAPATVALAADYERTEREYPDHGERYVHVEVGHAAENVLLVCEERGLNACPVGAFSDDELADVLGLDDDLAPLYLVPFGRPERDGRR